ncbi:CD3324 family protein [Peribacillus sp. SCS-26]|uniref:CD3324 family protein n=1 Tax=Paraperibacillus marinus TaxID=3115295 RepID=UPI00390590F0
MKYVRAAAVLPQSLISEIQKYVQGETIYIPKPETAHEKWGTQSGSKRILEERNQQMKMKFNDGIPISELAAHYHLSQETIKKIVYKR